MNKEVYDLAHKLADKFIHAIHSYSVTIPIKLIEKYKTPNGYAIIIPHGFDTRVLMEKWKDYDITLKKDDLLFLDMITNEWGDNYKTEQFYN